MSDSCFTVCVCAQPIFQRANTHFTLLFYCRSSGQMFCFLVPGQATAVTLANIFIGLNNAYSGFIATPALLTRNIFFAAQYWIIPGHYVFEGLTLSLFYGDKIRSVTVSETSPYFSELGCGADASSCTCDTSGSCTVSVGEYFNVYFDGMWIRENWWFNLVVLIIWSACIRIIGSIALKYLKYSGK